jgi:hypothetical protein
MIVGLAVPLSCALSWWIPSAAQAPQPTRADIVLSDAHTFVLRRPGTTEDYRIFVALPSSYTASEKRYPVLYTLDANSAFAMITQSYRLLRVDSSTHRI